MLRRSIGSQKKKLKKTCLLSFFVVLVLNQGGVWKQSEGVTASSLIKKTLVLFVENERVGMVWDVGGDNCNDDDDDDNEKFCC